MVFNFISSSTPATPKTQASSVKAGTFNFVSSYSNASSSSVISELDKTSAANLDNLIALNTEKLNKLPEGSAEYRIAERRLASLVKTRKANPTPVATALTSNTVTTANTTNANAATIATALKAANLPAYILNQALAKLGLPTTSTSTTTTTSTIVFYR